MKFYRNEWKKAELEGDNYYVYVVTGLRVGSTPTISIIRNPRLRLKPDDDPVMVSSWEHAVEKRVTFAKELEFDPQSAEVANLDGRDEPPREGNVE